MTTTLEITVEYDAASGFSYALSYTTGGVNYTGTVDDGGTVEFFNASGSSGDYTLSGPSGPSTFTFDDVNVTLGDGLGSSKECGCSGSFDLGSIVFPVVPQGESQELDPYAWCQEITSQAVADTGKGKFVDPQLGLSNTTGSTGVPVSGFPSCSCSGC